MNTLINLLSFAAILSSVLVITSKNPVVAVIFLIFLFINTALYLIFLGIGFVGISYIIVYVGAITVLFLFVILMINIRLLDILDIGSDYTKNLPLAFLVGTLFVYEIFSVIPFSFNNIAVLNPHFDIFNFTNEIFLPYISSYSSIILPIVIMTLPSPEFFISDFSQISVLGQGLYTYGAMWLLLSSIILLLSMVSAILLSKNTSILANL